VYTLFELYPAWTGDSKLEDGRNGCTDEADLSPFGAGLFRCCANISRSGRCRTFGLGKNMSESQHKPGDHSVPSSTSPNYRSRDALSLLMIGSFFFGIGLLVLAGQFFGEASGMARGVNLAAGGVLLAAAVGMLTLSRRLRSGRRSSDSS